MDGTTEDPANDIATARKTHDHITGLERERDAALRQVTTMSRSRDALIEVLKGYATSCSHGCGPSCHSTKRARETLDLLGVVYDR